MHLPDIDSNKKVFKKKIHELSLFSMDSKQKVAKKHQFEYRECILIDVWLQSISMTLERRKNLNHLPIIICHVHVLFSPKTAKNNQNSEAEQAVAY